MAASQKKNGHDDHADGIVEDRKQAPPAYFNILFYGLIIWGVVFSAYYLLSGWSSAGEFEEKLAAHTQTYSQATPAAAAPEGAEESTGINAAALYSANCAMCHGAQGHDGFATDLTGTYSFGKDPESIRSSIAEGRGANMPAFGTRLSAEEIAALVAYLLEL